MQKLQICSEYATINQSVFNYVICFIVSTVILLWAINCVNGLPKYFKNMKNTIQKEIQLKSKRICFRSRW